MKFKNCSERPDRLTISYKPLPHKTILLLKIWHIVWVEVISPNLQNFRRLYCFDLFDSSYNINEIMPLLQQFNLHQLINCFYPLVLGNGPSLCPLLPLAITGVENELSQTMLIQFKAEDHPAGPGTLHQGQEPSIKARHPPSRPGTLHQGQAPSNKARHPPTRLGTLHQGQGPSIKAMDPPSRPGTLHQGQLSSIMTIGSLS